MLVWVRYRHRAVDEVGPGGGGRSLAPRAPGMHRDGLNLGQIPFPSSYTRPPKIQAGPTPSSSPTLQIGPMFELAAGQIQRPFNERSSVPTTLVSSLVHGVMLLGLLVLVSSGEIALPDPQEALHLTAILVAAPPPPPPPAAAPPAPAPPAPEPSEVPLPEVPSVLPELDLLIPEPVEEETPELSLPAAPALMAGFGSGFGSGEGSWSCPGFVDTSPFAGRSPQCHEHVRRIRRSIALGWSSWCAPVGPRNRCPGSLSLPPGAFGSGCVKPIAMTAVEPMG